MKMLKSHKCFDGVTQFYEHHSETIGLPMKFSVHRPSSKKKIQGGLIWLSGLTCNEENFITKAGAQRILNELGLAVICPDTSPRGLSLPEEHDAYDFGSGAGFYLDATTQGYKDHYKMYSYVNDELYQLFNDLFSLEQRISIFGHSMGGHGALTIGLKNPDKYCSISAFSPIVNPTQCAWGQKAFLGYLGDNQDSWEKYDACSLLRRGSKHPAEILIDQGLDDDFYPEQLLTKNFVTVSKDQEQKTKVRLREGYDHSYYFISTFIEDHIRHHANFLS